MHYEVSEDAMKHLTLAQVKALASLDRWKADRIVVHTDFPTNVESSHGEGYFMICTVWLNALPEKCLIAIGISPKGDMHS